MSDSYESLLCECIAARAECEKLRAELRRAAEDLERFTREVETEAFARVTLRDHFAAAALTRLLGEYPLDRATSNAFEVADAMLAKRKA